MAVSAFVDAPPRQPGRIKLPGGPWPWLAGAGIGGWLILVLIVVMTVLGAKVSSQPDCGQSAASGLTAAGQQTIPQRLVSIYQGAADRFKLGPDGWLYLASINKVETGFWTNQNTSTAGAQGPMQFMPDTWASQGIDGDGDGDKDIRSEPDAIYGAASYLRNSGAPGSWQKAIFAYNHAQWYVDDVVENVEKWRGDPGAAVSSSAPAAAVPVSSPTGGGGGGGLDAAAATAAAKARTGQVGFAVASSTGAILASYQGDRQVNGRSITKAMLLVAFLEDHKDSAITAGDQATLSAMIRQSDNPSANRIYAKVGSTGVMRVSDQASMRSFRLSTRDPLYTLGEAQVTAADQARLFAMIDQLIPAGHRDYGLGLLSRTDVSWGMLNAGLGAVPSKAGWSSEPSGGWTVNQGAQVTAQDGKLGVAVTTGDQASWAYGQTSIEQVTRALNLQAASAGTAGLGTAECGGEPVDLAGMTLSPGERSRVLPDGTATIPQDAPPEVQAMLVAGNKIVQRFPYVYGGGHATGASMNQTSPAPVGGGYDCSSSVSYALWGAGPRLIAMLSNTPQASGALESFGMAGPGRFVTIYTNAGHAFMGVAGVWMNTGHYTDGTAPLAAGHDGPHWGNAPPPPSYAGGFIQRHPGGL